MTIGKKIMDRRIELGMTQLELAEKVGFKSRSSINKIELGHQDVRRSQVIRFSEALDCSIAYLMGFPEENQYKNELIEIVKSMSEEECRAMLLLIKR